MALWTKADTLAGAPKFLQVGTNFPAANTARDHGGMPPQQDKNNAYLVDTTEASVVTNRAKGIKTPGWGIYREYGAGRKNYESLVAFKVSSGTAGDLGVTGNTTQEDTRIADA